MDLVYIVRPGDDNEELRYSLRSAVNLPHDNVWIVGYAPPWLQDVHRLPTVQSATRWLNSTANVAAACTKSTISDPFVLMNDDFFALRPLTEVPLLHRGPVSEVLAGLGGRLPNVEYINGLLATAERLRELGYPDPISYELHAPLVVHKAPMLKAIEVGADITPFHKRTAYGNLAGLGGTQVRDVKVHGKTPADLRAVLDHDPDFLSTLDSNFKRGAAGRYIRDLFPTPSRFEVT